MGYIYRIRCIATGKDYIGITKNYVRRWADHINKIDKKGGCPALKAAMLKHGIDKFKFEILIICFDEDMTKLEPEYIKKYGTLAPKGYNISEGGEATYGFKGKTHSEEALKKIGEASKKRFMNIEEREKQSQRIKQVFAERGEEYKQKIREGQQNSPQWKLALELGLVGGQNIRHTQDTKKKISSSLKQYYETIDNDKYIHIEQRRESMAKAVGKCIIQYDLNGVKLNEFCSINEAARVSTVSYQGIRRCALGELKTIRGYIFKFKQDVKDGNL